MKNLIIAVCAVLLSVNIAEARPRYPHPIGFGRPSHHYIAPRHHHSYGSAAAGFVAGLIGGTILNYAVNPPRTTTVTYSPVTYVPTAVSAPVVSAPVVSAPVAVTTSQPCVTNTNMVTGATSTTCSSIITSSPTTIYMTN